MCIRDRTTTTRAATAMASDGEDGTVEKKSRIGLCGLAVMGQNLALNVASKSFKVSCYNREDEFSMRLFEALEIAKRDISNGDDVLRVFKDLQMFVESLKKPRYALFFFVALFLHELNQFKCKIVNKMEHKRFEGFNRARGSLIEACILASRVKILKKEYILKELNNTGKLSFKYLPICPLSNILL